MAEPKPELQIIGAILLGLLALIGWLFLKDRDS